MNLRYLASFHYFDVRDGPAAWLDRLAVRARLMFDSGAFSAMTQGAPIDLHDYGRYLVTHQAAFECYVNLDVIRDPDTTWHNQQVLEQEYGLTPMPVFHAGTDRRWLTHYLDRYDYIALGGIALVRGEARSGWLARNLAAAGNHRFHYLGVTNQDVLVQMTPYSADSSSWGAGYRYGRMHLWTGRRIVNVDRRLAHRHGRMVRDHGGDPALISGPAPACGHAVAGVNAVAWLRFTEWLAARRRNDFRLYLADTSPWWHERVATFIAQHFPQEVTT